MSAHVTTQCPDVLTVSRCQCPDHDAAPAHVSSATARPRLVSAVSRAGPRTGRRTAHSCRAAPRQARQQRSPARRLDRHQHGGWEPGDRGWRSGGLQEAARGQGRGALAATTPAPALLPALLLLTCTNRFWLGSAGLWRSGVCRRRCLSDKLGRAQQAALRLITQSFINFW